MFKALVIIIIAYYLIRKVGGFFLKTFVEESNQKDHQKRRGFTYTHTHQKNNKEGEVHIKPPHRKKETNDYKGGEYVDFEELDE